MWKNPRCSLYYYGLLVAQLLYRHCIPNEAFVVQPIAHRALLFGPHTARAPVALAPPLMYYESSGSSSSSNNNNNEVRTSDPPLASFLKNTSLINNFSLANTPEDCIDLQIGQRLVCIGDVHGDFQALQDFLTLAGVYDIESNTWCGDNTILVQCGDVLDRYSQELKCYQLLAQLSREAPEDGGKVIVLLGNHEILNAMGLFQYATTDLEYEQVVGPVVDEELKCVTWRMQYVGNQPARWASYEPGGLLANSLLANMKVAVQVGRTVCVHAGLTAEHIQDFGGLSNMNQQAHDWLSPSSTNSGSSSSSSSSASSPPLVNNVTFNNKGDYESSNQRFAEAEARQTSYINTAPSFLNGGIGANSPIWMRDYSTPNDMPPKNPRAQQMIDAALFAVGNCDRMVMGHTVQRRINAALQGKAWRVDVGASRGVIGGTPEVLEIVKTNDGTEEVSVLTKTGRVPASEREILYFSM
jgi:hypothetical protein